MQTSKGIVELHGISLRQFYQDAACSRKHRIFIRFYDAELNPAWEINGFNIHDKWIELY